MKVLAKRNFVNLDADESVFFLRQLESVKTKSYDVEYPELLALSLIPVSMDAGTGAQTITYRQYDMLGMARVISNYANDLPRVDVKGKEFTAKVRSLGASYGYSVQDIRSAQFAGIPLEQRKANAAKRAIMQLIDDIAVNGDSVHQLGGLLSNANVPDTLVPVGASTTTPWSTKTADEILADMTNLASAPVDVTLGVELPTTMLLPLAQYNLIAQKRLSNINMTVLQFFLQNAPHIKEVKPWNRLKGAGASGSDVALVYNPSPDKLTLEIPQDFEQFPVQEKGLEYETPCHARTAGVIIYYPLSLAKAHGI